MLDKENQTTLAAQKGLWLKDGRGHVVSLQKFGLSPP